MKIINKEADRIQSECTPEELGRALQGLDLESIPPHKKWEAIRDRLNEVMLATTTDPKERSKELFQKAATTYGSLRRNARKTNLII